MIRDNSISKLDDQTARLLECLHQIQRSLVTFLYHSGEIRATQFWALRLLYPFMSYSQSNPLKTSSTASKIIINDLLFNSAWIICGIFCCHIIPFSYSCIRSLCFTEFLSHCHRYLLWSQRFHELHELISFHEDPLGERAAVKTRQPFSAREQTPFTPNTITQGASQRSQGQCTCLSRMGSRAGSSSSPTFSSRQGFPKRTAFSSERRKSRSDSLMVSMLLSFSWKEEGKIFNGVTCQGKLGFKRSSGEFFSKAKWGSSTEVLLIIIEISGGNGAIRRRGEVDWMRQEHSALNMELAWGGCNKCDKNGANLGSPMAQTRMCRQ